MDSTPSTFPSPEPPKPKLRWQDAVGIFGGLISLGGMTDMPVGLRITLFILGAACMSVSFWSHQEWPKWIRYSSGAGICLLMLTVSAFAWKNSFGHIPTAQENAEATAKLLGTQPAPINGFRVERHVGFTYPGHETITPWMYVAFASKAPARPVYYLDYLVHVYRREWTLLGLMWLRQEVTTKWEAQ